jgi:hypothetical protein
MPNGFEAWVCEILRRPQANQLVAEALSSYIIEAKVVVAQLQKHSKGNLNEEFFVEPFSICFGFQDRLVKVF